MTEEYICPGAYRLHLVEHARIVFIDGHPAPIKLTPLEYTLFRALLARPRMLVLNSELLAQCNMSGSVDHYSRVIERHIDNVRRKLRQGGVGDLCILRVVSYGYVLLPNPERVVAG